MTSTSRRKLSRKVPHGPRFTVTTRPGIASNSPIPAAQCWPTRRRRLNQVDTVNLNAAPFLNYDYQGRLLDKRRTTTTAPGGTTIYEYDVGYDSHRRVNSIANRFQPGGGSLQTLAAYGFSHDANGNPLTQTVAEGMAGFVADDAPSPWIASTA